MNEVNGTTVLDLPSVLDVSSLPDKGAMRRYHSLVGLENQKSRLVKQITALFKPSHIESWAQRNGSADLAQMLKERPPLYILAGDVGCGKTELAETIGDTIARELDINVKLYRLSLSTRGGGLVGEMTKLISSAFAKVRADAASWRNDQGDARVGAILFIDEADSLAESRETTEMHHEDRVGVNALIRGVNDLASYAPPVAVIMATNRAAALDPAISRRAADIIMFERPNDAHRKEILKALGPPLRDEEIDELVQRTGTAERPYGYTYSDLRQRLIPNILLAAFPDGQIDMALVIRVMEQTAPTPPFRQNDQS